MFQNFYFSFDYFSNPQLDLTIFFIFHFTQIFIFFISNL